MTHHIHRRVREVQCPVITTEAYPGHQFYWDGSFDVQISNRRAIMEILR